MFDKNINKSTVEVRTSKEGARDAKVECGVEVGCSLEELIAKMFEEKMKAMEEELKETKARLSKVERRVGSLEDVLHVRVPARLSALKGHHKSMKVVVDSFPTDAGHKAVLKELLAKTKTDLEKLDRHVFFSAA